MTILNILIIITLIILLKINNSLNSLKNSNLEIKNFNEKKLQILNQTTSTYSAESIEELKLLNKQLNNIQYIIEAGLNIKAEDVVPELINEKRIRIEKIEEINEMEHNLETLRHRLRVCGEKFSKYKSMSENSSLPNGHQKIMAQKTNNLIAESEEIQKQINELENKIKIEKQMNYE